LILREIEDVAGGAGARLIGGNLRFGEPAAVRIGEEVISGSYGAISKTLKDGGAVDLEKPKEGEKK